MKISRSISAFALGAAALLPAVLPAQATSRPAPPRPKAAIEEQAPNGATGRCQDGSFVTSRAVASECASHGGVLVAFPVREAPPRPGVAASAPSSAALASSAPLGTKPVVAPPTPPAAARADAATPASAQALCRDGKPVGATSDCAKLGGVAVVLPATAAPAAPARGVSPRAVEPMGAPRPDGATAQCNDGSYVVGATTATTCSTNGGLAVAFPVERKPPAAEARANPAPSAADAPRGRATPAKRPARRNP